MNEKLKDKNMDDLFEAILCLETVEECYKFFDDLCTVLELKALAQRLQVAKMLSEKEYIVTLLIQLVQVRPQLAGLIVL